MTAPHPVPLAASALYQLVKVAAAPQRERLRVDFGDPGEFEEPDAISIGLAVRAPESIAGAARRGLGLEFLPYDIGCTAQSWGGDDDEIPALARMVRVFECVDLVRDVCRAHRDLGLTRQVREASVTREAYSQIPMDRGELALVEFVVHIEAYRPRR